MAELGVAFDYSAPIGSRFGPEVIAEIAFIAPSTVNDGDITEPKLHDDAVSTRTIVALAVTEPKMADGAVSTRVYVNESITDDKIAPGALKPEKTAPGIVTSTDYLGNSISLNLVPCSAAEYAALDTVDPASMYFMSA